MGQHRGDADGSLFSDYLPANELLMKVENLKLFEVPGGFCNLTPYPVDSQVAAILSFGPRFLLPPEVGILECLSDFGKLHFYLEKKFGLLDPSQIFLELFHRHREEFSTLLDSDAHTKSLIECVLVDAFSAATMFFRSHPDVCVVQADKGKKTCLMLVGEYNTKMAAYVDKCVSTGIYVAARGSATRVAKSAFNRLRNDILVAAASGGPALQIPENLLGVLRSFSTTSVSLPRLYGTVKCHKEGAPIRPICSTLHWYTKPIQKIFLHCLRDAFSTKLCPQNVLQIDKVAYEVHRLVKRSGFVFVKMDVHDMYGSMNKSKIIAAIQRLLLSPRVQPILPISLLERMMYFSMETGCLVKYGDCVYKQVHGLPQGACDSGFLATLYLDLLLQIHYEELFSVHRVQCWWKYMDDILLYMPARYVDSFQRSFERITELQLEVDYEESVDDEKLTDMGVITCLSFLDMMIYRLDVNEGDQSFLVGRYMKPTASLRIIHALSSTILNYKINTIRGFLIKIFRRTSTPLLMVDIRQFYVQALHNGYPPNMLDYIFSDALRGEIAMLKNGDSFLRMTRQQMRARCLVLGAVLDDYPRANFEVVMEIRRNYVGLSSTSRVVFPFRSIALCHLLRLGCSYAGISMPIYSRADQIGGFRRFFANGPITRLVCNMDSERRRFYVGMVTCVTCGMFFIVSGRHNLEKILDEELLRVGSVLYNHQKNYGHVISPVVRYLRSVKNVDTAYLNTIYHAIFSSTGVSCSDSNVLAKVPQYIRSILGFLQGYGDSSETPIFVSPEVRLLLDDFNSYITSSPEVTTAALSPSTQLVTSVVTTAAFVSASMTSIPSSVSVLPAPILATGAVVTATTAVVTSETSYTVGATVPATALVGSVSSAFEVEATSTVPIDCGNNNSMVDMSIGSDNSLSYNIPDGQFVHLSPPVCQSVEFDGELDDSSCIIVDTPYSVPEDPFYEEPHLSVVEQSFSDE